MATGDVRGNLERLRVQLHSIQYPHTFDVQGLKQGIPPVILPLLHYALLGYSRHVARFLSTNGYELYAKSDLRFVESVLKFLRQEFNYRSALTIAQIFSRGYAERKLLFIYDVIQITKRKHNELVKLAHEKKAATNKPFTETTNLVSAKVSRACEDWSNNFSPFTKTRPWEETLRKPTLQDNGTAAVPVSSVDISDSDRTRRAGSPKVECEPRPREPHPSETSKESNISSGLSSPRTGQFVTHDTHAYIGEVEPCSPSQPSSRPHDESNHRPDERHDDRGQASDQDRHEELCQNIMHMAGRLEARFISLEDGVTKATATLQDKLLTLEHRVSLLERGRPNQELQENVSQNINRTEQLKSSKFISPRPRLEENFQNCGPPAACEVQHPQLIRDISNTLYYKEKPSLQEAYTNQMKLYDKGSPLFHDKVQRTSNTQEFIAGIKARFNRTLEVLLRNTSRLGSNTTFEYLNT